MEEDSSMASRLAELVREFKKVPSAPLRPGTYLETAGYPHFENVISNLLAFFLNPLRDHGLGRLFLDSLLDPLALGDVVPVSIEREEVTGDGTRVDLLIDCQDHVIGIENKVFAPVYNPLDSYWAHVTRMAGERRPVLVLLSLREPPPATLPSFVSVVTYEPFMARVRQRLGTHAGEAPAQYLVFALDLVKTMENLLRGGSMDPAIVKLFSDHHNDVAALLGVAKRFNGELRSVVRHTGDIVATMFPRDLPIRPVLRYYSEDENLLQVLVHDLRFPSGAVVAVDATRSPRGWTISVFQRTGSVLPKGELIGWLERAGVPFVLDEDQAGRGERVLAHNWVGERPITAEFAPSAPIEDVAAHVAEVVTAVARASAAPGESPAVVELRGE